MLMQTQTLSLEHTETCNNAHVLTPYNKYVWKERKKTEEAIVSLTITSNLSPI